MNMINEKGKMEYTKGDAFEGLYFNGQREGYDDDVLIKKDWFIKEIKRLKN